MNINKNGLYQSTPEKLNYSNPYGASPYHCKNFTFKPVESKGKWYMVDTYFDEWHIEVTEKNIDLFEYVFDWSMVVQISKEEYYRIAENKRYWVAVDSGGRKYAKQFKDITAKPVREIVKKENIEKISFYKRQIEQLTKELETIDHDERYE